jgi:hypothetical protein
MLKKSAGTSQTDVYIYRYIYIWLFASLQTTLLWAVKFISSVCFCVSDLLCGRHIQNGERLYFEDYLCGLPYAFYIACVGYWWRLRICCFHAFTWGIDEHFAFHWHRKGAKCGPQLLWNCNHQLNETKVWSFSHYHLRWTAIYYMLIIWIYIGGQVREDRKNLRLWPGNSGPPAHRSMCVRKWARSLTWGTE